MTLILALCWACIASAANSLSAANKQHVFTADSIKVWVQEYEDGRFLLRLESVALSELDMPIVAVKYKKDFLRKPYFSIIKSEIPPKAKLRAVKEHDYVSLPWIKLYVQDTNEWMAMDVRSARFTEVICIIEEGFRTDRAIAEARDYRSYFPYSVSISIDYETHIVYKLKDNYNGDSEFRVTLFDPSVVFAGSSKCNWLHLMPSDGSCVRMPEIDIVDPETNAAHRMNIMNTTPKSFKEFQDIMALYLNIYK